MASANLSSYALFATLESDATQRDYILDTPSPQRLVRVENVGSAAAVIAELGHTIAMNADSPSQRDGERLIPAGSSVILTRNIRGFVHKSTTGTFLAVEDATQ